MDKIRRGLQLYLSAMAERRGYAYLYVIGYEELAVPYIIKCMEAGATKKAYEEAINLVSLNPSSDLGLRYAINSSGLLGKYDEFEKYTAQGINYYPEEPFYQAKRATVLERDKRYEASLEFRNRYSINTE